jgi:integrase
MAKRQRRLRGEGSIRQRADKFEIRFPLPVGPDGKRHRIYRYAPDKKAALAALAELREEVKHPTRKDAALTVSDYLLNQWLPLVATELRPMTTRVYRYNVLTHIVPVIGNVPLAALTPADIDRVKTTALQTLKPSTARLVRGILGAALKQAEKSQVPGARDVVRLSKPPKVERREYQWLTVSEGVRFLKAAQTSPYATLYLTTLSLGLRLGEVRGLTWTSVDLDHAQVTISRQLQHVGGKLTLLPLKTEASAATIPLPSGVVTALRELKARQIVAKVNAPVWLESWGLVFAGPNGEPINRTSLGEDFRAVLQRAGLERMRFHDLRHSAASILLGQGVPMKVVQLILRHARIGVTMDVYAHLVPEQLTQAAAAMEAAFGDRGQ